MAPDREKLTGHLDEKRKGGAVTRYVLTLGGILTVIGLLAYGFTTDPRAIPSILTGKQAPDFSLTLLDGRSVRLSDFRGKKNVVMAFYPLAFTPV